MAHALWALVVLPFLPTGSSLSANFWQSVEQETNVDKLVADGFQGPASSTKYWDCAYQHCQQFLEAVPGNTWRCNDPLKLLQQNFVGSLNKTEFFAHPNLGLFEKDGHIYGTAAVSATLGVNTPEKGSPGCGKCFDLKAVNSRMKKPMTIMATNYCPECKKGKSPWGSHYERYHFDFAVPGGGQGLAPHCELQYPEVEGEPKYEWSTKYAGGCAKLPDELKESCQTWFKNFHGEWPDMMFKQVACPRVLTQRLGCQQGNNKELALKEGCDCKWAQKEKSCAIKKDADAKGCWSKCCTPYSDADPVEV